MKLACPSCGALMSLDVVIAHDGAREAVQTALQLPAPLGKQLIQYVALFRPPKRQLTLDRLAGLLGELLPLVQHERVRRDGREYRAPHALWAAALQDMVDRRDGLSLPLKSHGYLLEIVAGKAGKVEAAVEQAVEEQRRHAPEGQRTGQPKAAKEAAAAGVAAMRGVLYGTKKQPLT